jgi:hypothetical protein
MNLMAARSRSELRTAPGGSTRCEKVRLAHLLHSAHLLAKALAASHGPDCGHGVLPLRHHGRRGSRGHLAVSATQPWCDQMGESAAPAARIAHDCALPAACAPPPAHFPTSLRVCRSPCGSSPSPGWRIRSTMPCQVVMKQSKLCCTRPHCERRAVRGRLGMDPCVPRKWRIRRLDTVRRVDVHVPGSHPVPGLHDHIWRARGQCPSCAIVRGIRSSNIRLPARTRAVTGPNLQCKPSRNARLTRGNYAPLAQCKARPGPMLPSRAGWSQTKSCSWRASRQRCVPITRAGGFTASAAPPARTSLPPRSCASTPSTRSSTTPRPETS